MTQQLKNTTDGLVELDSAEMMAIDGGCPAFFSWLTEALGVIAVVAIVIILL